MCVVYKLKRGYLIHFILIFVLKSARAITEKVLSISAIRESNSVSCYLSMESGEVNTSAIVDALFRLGEVNTSHGPQCFNPPLINGKGNKTLYVPKIRSKEGIMDFLQSYSADDLASFPPGTWGIREPGDLWEGKNRPSGEFFFSPPKNK